MSFILYLGGDAYSAPAIWKKVVGTSGAPQGLFFLQRDYLGSIVLVTDDTGTVMEKRQFDAWGNIAKLTDGSNNNLSNFLILDRGYTGHEHLLSVGLIHMNGRLYDARLGRFLSPDNYVQDPFSTQNFNRYSYALNNPMVYVDPSGEFILGTLFGVVGGFFKSIFSGGLEFWNADKQYVKDAWSDFGSSVSKGFAIDMGLWKTDQNKNFWGRSWELLSRFT